MSAPLRTHATTIAIGAPSRAVAAVTTAWHGPVTDVFVNGHKYLHRRPPL